MKKTLFAVAALAGVLTFSGGAIDIIVRAAGIKLE